MPIEIRELQITVIEEGQTAAPSEAAVATNEKIVAACVEQVMDILRQKNER
jgi:Family of unknown function (DUF5908)